MAIFLKGTWIVSSQPPLSGQINANSQSGPYTFSLVGIAEEYLFRGYLQLTLARGLSGILPRRNPYRNMLSFWLATILLSLLFFAAHTDNSGESPVGL